jgi:hypothetical protein
VLTFIQPRDSLLRDNLIQTLPHAVYRLILRCHMRPTLDRNIRISNARRRQLPDRTQIKRVRRRHAPPLLERVLQLLENGVLKNWIDDEDERGQHASEERSRALVADQRHEGPDRGGCFLLWTLLAPRERILLMLFPRRHPCIHHPDGIRQQDRRRPGDGACDHALDRRELLARTAGLLRRFFKEGPGPFIPVVVDEVGDGNAEEGGVEAGVQAGETFTLDDVLDGGEEGGGRAGSLDLGAGRERDERIGERHGNETAAGAGEGVGDVVGLLRGGGGSFGGAAFGHGGARGELGGSSGRGGGVNKVAFGGRGRDGLCVGHSGRGVG